MKLMIKNKQSGQVALIVLLIMIVILTIGLSLASRSITDVRISQDEKEALRAFSAAEAGIEEALKDITPFLGPNPPPVTVGNLSAEVTVGETGEGTTQLVEQGEIMNVLLNGSTANTLNINWIDENKTDELDGKASIEVIVYADDYTFKRFGYNPEGGRSTGFTDVSVEGDDNFLRKVDVTIDRASPKVDVLVRIRPLYDKATIKVTTNDTSLPVQQYDITSEAVTEGEKIGKIIVSRTVPVVPSIFDYVLFSGGNLSN